VLAPVFLLGALAWGVPLLVLGFADRSDGIVDAASVLFIISLVGVLLVLAAVAVPVALTVISRAAVIGGAERADADPWATGATLEWLTDSPPAPGNFSEPPDVTSPEPLLDANDGGAS
jgi:cytochrome o ubiquinol oxidase subunit I